MLNKDFFKSDKFKIILRSVLVFIFFNYSYVLQYIPVLLFHINIDSLENDFKMQAILSTYSSLVVFIVLFLVYRKEIVQEFKTFLNKLLKNIDTGFKCWITGLLIMFAANMILLVLFKSGGAKNENAVQSLISALPYIIGFNVCLLAPFNEEIVFRKTFKDVFKNPYVFIFLSFLFFGGAHVFSSAESLVDILYIIPYGALGATFAWAYSKTDTVFTSMLFHMIHNTLIFLISVFL